MNSEVKQTYGHSHVMKSLLIIFAGLAAMFLSSCSSLPEQYTASTTRSLVECLSSSGPVKKDTFSHIMFGMLDPNDHSPVTTERYIDYVRIAFVDKGDVLLKQPEYKIWLETGAHKLLVTCATEYSWGSIMVSTQVELNVQADYKYFLTLRNPLMNSSDKPDVNVSKKEIK